MSAFDLVRFLQRIAGTDQLRIHGCHGYILVELLPGDPDKGSAEHITITITPEYRAALR